MIDSHCHLADTQFEKDTDEVIERAIAAGVTTMVTIADTFGEGERCIEIAKKYENIFCTIGVHPHEAKSWQDGDEERLRTLVGSSEKVKAVGEIGLDYHYMNSPKDIQQKVFRTQLSVSKELDLPVVVHCREAVDDVWSIVDDVKPEKLVLHCCTEKFADVEGFLKAGYFLSFTGIATYPQAEEIRETIRRTPMEQLMIETDAPYLAPVPHRGKRNEPAYVTEVATFIAELKGISFEEVDRITSENAIQFFGLPS